MPFCRREEIQTERRNGVTPFTGLRIPDSPGSPFQPLVRGEQGYRGSQQRSDARVVPWDQLHNHPW
jgi:hypothetical protein